MSQKLDGVKKIEKLVEQPEIVLRPLSAKLLPPTIPEIEGWIDREQLYDISGRNRQRQLELAKNIGNEKAVRAVANANGANSIAIIIPCHRIIGTNGELTGFGGGLPLKKRLLELEQNLFAI